MTDHLLTMTDAAKAVSIDRTTLYRHIKEKGISVTKDENNNSKIDPSELIRVYGKKFNLDNLKEEKSDKEGKASVSQAVANNTDATVAEDKLKKSEEERDRERKQFEDRIQHLSELLEDQKEQTKRITLLLENHSKSDDKDEWKLAIKTLESRIANQESKAEEEKERAQKILRQNQALKKQLEEEKNKSFWAKLFG